MEDDYASKKAEEALRLNLPSLRSFTGRGLRWCGQRLGRESFGEEPSGPECSTSEVALP
jgi:hypothetical protein